MNHQSQCPHCYEWFHGSHYCPALNKRALPVERAAVSPTLTERRVREIVREELERVAVKGQS